MNRNLKLYLIQEIKDWRYGVFKDQRVLGLFTSYYQALQYIKNDNVNEQNCMITEYVVEDNDIERIGVVKTA